MGNADKNPFHVLLSAFPYLLFSLWSKRIKSLSALPIEKIIDRENKFTMDDFYKKLQEELEAEAKKKKSVEYGKLGGRPKKEIRKTERITLRFTPEEIQTIISKSEEKKLNTTDYCRLILNEKTLPNFEQNKILIEYANNFSRISNYMKMGIFNENEKAELTKEIKNLISELREKIQWL